MLVSTRGAAATPSWQPPGDVASTARREAAAAIGVDVSATALAPGYDIDQLRLPRCAGALSGRGTRAPWVQARLSIEVQCASPYWRVFVPIAVEATRRVVVLARALPAGTVLGPADLTVAERELGSLPGDAYADPNAVVGARLLRNSGSGQPVVSGWIRRAPAVRRGQPVTILAQNASVSIRAEGVATSDGQIAERVLVRNRSSGREVDAVVRSTDLVEVALQ
ncbi:MAG: flagellar basal body P-ring formation chaperone FlgA [Dehalococcoidia bacterium]